MHNLLSGMIHRMFMGRCGYDELSRFLAFSSPVPFLLAIILRRTAGGYPSMFLLFFLSSCHVKVNHLNQERVIIQIK